MTEVGTVDSDRWEEGGCTRARCVAPRCLWCLELSEGSEGELSQLKKMWPSNAPTRHLPGATQPLVSIGIPTNSGAPNPPKQQPPQCEIRGHAILGPTCKFALTHFLALQLLQTTFKLQMASPA